MASLQGESIKMIEEKSVQLLTSIAQIRANLDVTLRSLREKEALIRQREEAEKLRRQQEERELLAKQQIKAWTMPDDEPENEAPVESVPAAQAPAEAAEPEKPSKPSVPEQEQPKPAAEAAVVKETEPVQAEQPVQAAPVKEEPQAAAPAAEKQEVRPAAAAAAAKPVQPQARVPQQGTGMPARPQGQTAYTARPPMQGQGSYGNRPQGQNAYSARPPMQGQGTYNNRPPMQGQRPAQPGAYGNRVPGRPAQGQPMGQGRYPQQGAQGAGMNRGGFRPQNQSGYAPRPQGQGNFQNRPQAQGRPAQNRSQGSGGYGRSKSADLLPVLEKERVSNYDPNKKQYIRQHDPERVAKNRKQLERENFVDYDDEMTRGGRKAKTKKPSAQQMMAPIKIEKAFMTAETITVKDLTERIGKPAPEILKKLLMLGIVSNINSELDFDTASLVCGEFGVTLEKKLDKTAEDVLIDTRVEDTEEDLKPRPPVITIMGHVDHGKTSLLDYIRSSHVTAGEAGGITQHIGAYTVDLNGRTITFLDTPGHEAFTAMRMRGAQATDIAVLVVAADDGVMPQTIEAINHAKAAKVPLIVAINKMDKPAANPERIKEELTKYDLVPEEWGGDTIVAPVSALTGQGVDELLELILLQADMLQLKANPDRLASGVIIEAKLDKARGPIATVLLKNGTLHVGDNIIAGMASGRVRAMTNDRGERVKSAGPSMPVEIAGFDDVPSAGDEMMAVGDDKLMRQVAEERKNKLKAARSVTAKVSLETLFEGINEGKTQNLNLIIKADVQGSVEAVKQALEKLSNDAVKIHVLHSAVGAITQDDVNLAATFGATIIGFNIRPDNQAKDAAEKLNVEVRLYRIIYQAIEDIEKAMKGMLEPEYKETVLGHAQVRNTFKITGVGTIAGCYVTDGKLQRNAQVRLLRDNVVVFEGKLSSLRRFKDDVREAAQGFECGVGLENYNDVKENDVVECFIMEEIDRD